MHFQRVILVHYHEIGLKGHNRSKFENRLVSNILSLTKKRDENSPVCACHRISGRVVVYLKEGTGREEQLEVEKFLSKVPGIQRVSAGFKCERDYSTMKQLAIEALKDAGDFQTFKVQAKRNHTDFEVDSMTMNKEIGSVLCKAFPDKKVKMKDVDVQVNVEVIQNMCFICAHTLRGIGGLPAGVSGKVVCMLSSGIDSPVATWKMAKRGATCIGVHFSGRPQTSSTSEDLVSEIAEQLSKYGCLKEFWICPIGDFQKEIMLKCDPSLRIILYRRLMFRVASEIANMRGARAIATGESLGQVASQTIDNMIATSNASNKLVLRPLIGEDKLEIIEVAKEIGTFDISSQEASDCCTLFMPKAPETHAKLDVVKKEDEEIGLSKMVSEILKKSEVHKL